MNRYNNLFKPPAVLSHHVSSPHTIGGGSFSSLSWKVTGRGERLTSRTWRLTGSLPGRCHHGATEPTLARNHQPRYKHQSDSIEFNPIVTIKAMAPVTIANRIWEKRFNQYYRNTSVSHLWCLDSSWLFYPVVTIRYYTSFRHFRS